MFNLCQYLKRSWLRSAGLKCVVNFGGHMQIIKTLNLVIGAKLRKVMHLGKEAYRPCIVFPLVPEVCINPTEIKETR